MEYYRGLVTQGPTGRVINGSTVTVYLADKVTPASLFEVDGVTSQDNPITSGHLRTEGEYEFKVLDGEYWVKVVSGSEIDEFPIFLYDVNASTFQFQVETRVALRGETPIAGKIIYCKSHTTLGDGGHLVFRGVTGAPATTYSDNNGTTILPTGGDGSTAWIGQSEGYVDVRLFGAKFDGVTNDYSAISNALSAHNNVIFPEGRAIIDASTLSLIPPFNIRGSGAGNTIVSFTNLTSSIDGFSIQQAGNRTINSITDLTIEANGSDGRYAITTPRGTSVFNTNTPTYHFERLKFRGDTEDTLEGLYTHGWNRYINLGDGVQHTIRDVEIKGFYDYRDDPALVTTDSTVGVHISGLAGEGGVLMPIIDHVFIHYVGIPVQFDYQVSNPFIVDSQFHRCYRGIYSPRTTSGNQYGVLEAQLSNLNINSQLNCIFVAESAFFDVSNVRTTRADGGFDHSNTWVGIDIQNTDDLKITSTRAYNTSATYTNTHIGMNIENCDYVYISGYNSRSNLDRGLVLHDSTRVTVVGPTFMSGASSSIYFKYTAIASPEITIINDKHVSSITTPYAYDASITKESIIFFGSKTAYSSVDDSATGVTASGGTDNISVSSSNQVLRRQMNSSALNHTFDLQNSKAREGDAFLFRIQMVAGFTGTVSITPNGGGAIWSKVGPGSATQYVVEAVFTESSWILFGAYQSDA